MSVGISCCNDTKNKKLYLAFYVSNAEKSQNFIYVLEEYSAVHLKKREQVNNLFNEIKEIKKLRV